LYGQNLSFAQGQFYTLQAATHIPTPPPWATVVGQAYRLTASAGGPDLSQVSINFSYLGRDVPPGEERWVTAYYCPLSCPADGSGWRALVTARDMAVNQAIVAVPGPGLYALMSSVEIPLSAGDNVVAYPVHTGRTVADATASIASASPQVSRYNPQTGGWRALGAGELLEFGKGYRITVSQAATWRIKGDGVGPAALATTGASAQRSTPAIYSGAVAGDAGWTPALGQSVVAWVDGQRCGQGGTLADGARVVYVVAVAADAGLPGSGAPGHRVSFTVAGRVMSTTAVWDNRREIEGPLRP
jgi:hypothetical protein